MKLPATVLAIAALPVLAGQAWAQTKLPDNNGVVALQPVTGMQVSRNATAADQLLIRGLPDIESEDSGRDRRAPAESVRLMSNPNTWLGMKRGAGKCSDQFLQLEPRGYCWRRWVLPA